MRTTRSQSMLMARCSKLIRSETPARFDENARNYLARSQCRRLSPRALFEYVKVEPALFFGKRVSNFRGAFQLYLVQICSQHPPKKSAPQILAVGDGSDGVRGPYRFGRRFCGLKIVAEQNHGGAGIFFLRRGPSANEKNRGSTCSYDAFGRRLILGSAKRSALVGRQALATKQCF